MMKQTTLALLTTTALGLAATAQADLSWDWSFTGTGNSGIYFGPLVSGSGTLTTGPLSSGSYTVIGISGTFAGSAINGLNSSFGSPDNTLYTPGNNGSSNPADALILSPGGLAFNLAGDWVNIYDGSYILDSIATITYRVYDNNGVFNNSGTFTATQVTAAPEPSQVISTLTLAGVGGAGWLLKLRRRK